ncbi:SDR family NAD(P)-dependent oxidoreductase [Sulfitobacter sp. 15WGC]|jgi:NAD(P)-dependent dehydrogenase (short-subunit alcohol dehydrogenase family)|uniref:SDR family NAD(P)-dependent oxidoreductase n=1 Tax=Sulfitobacter sp. 15WGC TaxID=2575437 RepID=UPI0010ACA38F|nr:SDR family NAD(P)-dependent oxidoreductase [Sulfitobacter sp. 15WGC]TKA84450.1 SDR family NAD(P)-dependent oxidoreductase [Sulfitobacter sp. 15WGC]|tara:strand:- start:1212 stop:2129 length:918 start_codon:yes stop_codon:yes gene_type:complete
MPVSFKDQVAIVTGAGGGLGRSHALMLARHGAAVVVNDFGGGRDGSGGNTEASEAVVREITAEGGRAIANAGNVTSEADMAALVEQTLSAFGRIDVLINNAGILRDKSFAKMEIDDFRRVVDVHLLGTAVATKAVWAKMREQAYGRILVTSSTSGSYGNFGQANYGAAKMGVLGLMNVLHFEGAKYGIHLNAILPTAATRMTDDMMDPTMLELLTPELVSPAAVWLVSRDAPSRTALLAGAGTVSRLALVESQGVCFAGTDFTPDTVGERFEEIATLDRQIEVMAGLDHVDRIIANARAALATKG